MTKHVVVYRQPDYINEAAANAAVQAADAAMGWANSAADAAAVTSADRQAAQAAALLAQATSGAGIPTRPAFVAGNTAGTFDDLDDGQVVSAAGNQYRRAASQSLIPDLAGWEPVGDVTPEHFGAIGDGVANDTGALAAAFNRDGDLSGAGTYRITSTAMITSACQVDGLHIIWGGPASGPMLRLEHPDAVLSKCLFDGQNVASFGIIAPVGEIDRCEVKNFRSETGSAIGIQITGTVNPVRCIGNRVHHIHSVGDGSAGNPNGAARGIQIYTNVDIQNPHTVEGNSVWQITGEEGDGIHLLAIDGSGSKSAGGTSISYNTVWDCSKRCIKTQGADTRVVSNTVRLNIAGGYSAIDSIDGANTHIRNNTVTSEITGGRGIQMVGYAAASPRLAGGSVAGNAIQTLAGEAGIALNVRVVDDVEVSGNTMIHGRFVTDTSARLKVRGNLSRDMVASGSDGAFSFRNSTTNCDIEDNTATGGDPYTCIRVDAGGHKITGNRNNSVAQATPSAVLVEGGSSLITGNINAKAAVTVIRYTAPATEAGQVAVANNVQMVS